MRQVCVAAICVCGFWIGGEALARWPAQDALPYQLLIPGHYSSGELLPHADGEWSALTLTGSKVSLASVKVSLRGAANPNATGDLSLPGAIVEAHSPDSVLFLLRGGHWERRDAVPTWFCGDARLSPEDTLPLRGDGARRWQVSASGPEIMRSGQDSLWIYRIQVGDRSSGRSMQLGTWLRGTSPRIRWIGDLDDDGDLDVFLYDDTSETGSRRWTLYRAGQVRGKSLLERAAEFGLPGC